MDIKPLIVLLVGPPGSGKSTASNEFHPEDFAYINQDTQGKMHLDIFEDALKEGKSIVVDRMNFSKTQRDRYLEPAKKAGYHTRIEVFHTPMDYCIERCRQRRNHPTIKTEKDIQDAISFFFRKYERVEDTEAEWVHRHGWKGEDYTKAIWVDLDGTMAKVDHRLHHVRAENRKDRNWPKFFDEMVHDEVNEWCSELVHSMSDKYPIVYATGRPSDYRDHTELWLGEKGLTMPGSNLFMRLEKDYRRDDIVKEIILEFEVKTRYNLLFAVDDRKQVVDMLRKHSVTVLQCAEGLF